MLTHNPQPQPLPQPSCPPPLSQTHSHKTPTHLTIQQQNQNNKQPIKQLATSKSNKQPLKGEDKKFRKLSKQTKKVKSLEEEYRELEEELREVKELVRIQLEMIGCSVEEINQKVGESEVSGENVQAIITNHPNNAANNSTNNTPPFSSPSPLTITPLSTLLSQLFTYHSTIQTLNSNYLLLSQVHKQQESQQTFHINNLQERIRQLRFLLNGKEDLLAYEMATFDGGEVVGEDAGEVRRICVEYHLPRRESMAVRGNAEGEYRFVERVVGEWIRLRKEVGRLEQEVVGRGNVEKNENQEIINCYEKDEIKENQDEDVNKQKKGNNLSAPIKSTRLRQHNPQPFTQCQNTLLPAQTTRTVPKSPTSSPISKTPHTQRQLTLLPLSIQNYKLSLIYRVGKLQAVEQQSTQKLKEKYEQLKEQLREEQMMKRKLVKEYEFKRDVFEFKRKGLMGKQGASNGKQSGNTMGSILDELEEEKQIKVVRVDQQMRDDRKGKVDQQMVEMRKQIQENMGCQLPIETKIIQTKPTTPSKLPSIIDLNTSSTSRTSHSKYLSPQPHPIFHQLTNSQTTPNKKIQHSPFLKLKTSQSKSKHFSHHHDLITNTPVKEKKIVQEGDKENTPQKGLINLRQNTHVSEHQKPVQLEVESQDAGKGLAEKSVSKEGKQQKTEVKRVKSTLRKRRQNAKVNKK